MRQLFDQLARLTEEVAVLTARRIGEQHIYDAAIEYGRELERAALLGKAASTTRAHKPRPHYLQAVEGKRRAGKPT